MQHVTLKTLINVISLCDQEHESSSQCLPQVTEPTVAVGVLVPHNCCYWRCSLRWSRLMTLVGTPRPQKAVDDGRFAKGQCCQLGLPWPEGGPEGWGYSEDKWEGETTARPGRRSGGKDGRTRKRQEDSRVAVQGSARAWSPAGTEFRPAWAAHGMRVTTAWGKLQLAGLWRCPLRDQEARKRRRPGWVLQRVRRACKEP